MRAKNSSLLILLHLASAFIGYNKCFASGKAELLSDGFYLSDTILEEAIAESLRLKNDTELAHIFADELASRPLKCPLISSRPKELLDKMIAVAKGLKQGKCQSKGQELADEIGSLVGKMNYSYKLQTSPNMFYQYTNSLQLDSSETGTKTTLYSPDAVSLGMAAQSTNITKNLTQLLSDKDCAGDLKAKGFLTAIADITTAMGQFAFYVPSPQSLLAGTGAIALGSSLKILIKMFESPFDWSDAEDRQTFFSLNCSFYDLRRELEQAHFFEYNENSLKAKKDYMQPILKKIEDQLEKTQKERITIEENNLQSLKKYLSQEMGLEMFDVMDLTKQILAILNQNKIESEEIKSTVLVEISDKAINLLDILKQSKLSVNNKDILLDFLKKFSPDNIILIHQKDFLTVDREIFQPTKIYIRKLLSSIKPIEDEKEKNFLDLKNPSNNQTNRQILDYQKSRYEHVIEELSSLSRKINLRISLLEISSNRNSLEANDDGAQMAFDILNEYQKIRQFIFGYRGWSFLKFLMKDIKKQVKKFERSHTNWKSKYFLSESQVLSSEIGWACRDAQQLRINWDTANSGIELAFDFYNTNRGIIESNVPTYRLLFGFLPFDTSYEFRIYRNMLTGEIAYKILKGDLNHSPNDLIKIRKHRRTNLGQLTLQVKLNSLKRVELEKFLKSHNCGEAL